MMQILVSHIVPQLLHMCNISGFLIDKTKNLKLQTVPPPFCGNVNSTCLITPNNRWKQLSSINLSYFDVSSSPNYVTLSLYSSIGRGLPIGHSIHFNYHQKYHRSEETTHAPQSRHNGSNDIFCNRMQIRPVLVLYIYKFWILNIKLIRRSHLCATIATQYNFSQ